MGPWGEERSEEQRQGCLHTPISWDLKGLHICVQTCLVSRQDNVECGCAWVLMCHAVSLCSVSCLYVNLPT